MLCSTIRNVVPWRFSSRIISSMWAISVGFDPARRLVEHDQLRVEHEDLGQLDKLALAEGERSGLVAGEPLHAHELEQLVGALRLGATDCVGAEPAPGERAERCDDILEHGHPLEEAGDLERSMAMPRRRPAIGG